jgi:septum formation protein
MGVCHDIHPVWVEEVPLPGETPRDFTRRVALDKATTAWEELQGAGGRLVLGADTAVSLDGEIFGKPADADNAFRILERLSGRTHRVTTAVAAVMEGERRLRLSESRVTFGSLLPSDIDAYIASGEPLDKAGAYGIQGLAAVFVERLEGSYSGVMGLPIFETVALLAKFGLRVLSPPPVRRSA